jgi:hypothetical protein
VVVVAPAMTIVMTVVPFMTLALVSSMLVPPIPAFAPSASPLSPETPTHAHGSHKQQHQESSHLKPYLSTRRL